jgi:hypothetical protein
MKIIQQILDNQILDRHGQKMGKVDGIVVELRDRQQIYRIPWDKLDLTDPTQPCLTCTISQLAQPDRQLETDWDRD